MNDINLSILEKLVNCHSTPGDEKQVMKLMEEIWLRNKWKVSHYGHLAITAESPEWNPNAPTLLYCAHADSPGFIVQSTAEDKHSATLVALGGPHAEFNKKSIPVILHSLKRNIEGELTEYNVIEKSYTCKSKAVIERGSRVAFKPSFRTSRTDVYASFLDNRIGCYALAWLAENLDKNSDKNVNIIMAVTSNEEFLGFGANALAHAVSPDLVIVLDATYEEKQQNVIMGKGPVLTISDKSVLLSLEQCHAIAEICNKQKINLQTEIYNFSGTDARAFPNAGITCPILPILIATTGNHSPLERCKIADIKSLLKLLQHFAVSAQDIRALQ